MSGDLEEIYGGQGFDAEAQEPKADGFNVMPPHWNSFLVEELEVREAAVKDGVSGKYLWLKFDVIGERFRGRKVFQRITLQRTPGPSTNPETAAKSAKAVEIGMRDLGALASACGLKVVKSTTELANKTFDGRVKIKPAHGGFSEDNEIAAFAPIGTKIGTEVKEKGKAGAKPAPAPKAWEKPAETAQAAPAAAPASKPGKRPWE